MVIAEEFAHIHPDVYFKVIAATLVTGCAFIGITTLGDDTNYVHKLVKATSKKTGRSIFKVIELNLVCDDCKREDKAKDCKHLLGEIPYWHDDDRHRDLEQIMSGHEEDYLRETKGFNSSSLVSPAFDQQSIAKLMKSKPVTDLPYIKHIFVTVDPSAGGEKSKRAIVSCAYTGGKMVILGIENDSLKDPESQRKLLIRHLQRLRKIKGCEASKIVFLPEANLGWSGFDEAKSAQKSKLDGLIIMKEDNDRPGIKMSADLKQAMAIAMRDMLYHEKVVFHREFFTLTEEYHAEEIKDELIEQLENYSKILKPSNDVHKAPSVHYGGKLGYGYDDVAIATMLNLIAKRRFYSSEARDKYGKYH